VDKIRQVTAVIENHVECLASGKAGKRLLDTPVVLLFRLAFPGEDGNASGSNTGGVWFISRFLRTRKRHTHAAAA
jgi:hypothetical protein